MKRTTLPMLTVLLLFPLAALRAATIYVAPTGDDAQAGTDTQPLRTINRAAALVQAGDVVWIGAGVYRETVTIKASGTAAAPVVFQAAPGAAVIITGADPLTGWTREADGTYSVPWPHRLYQGDEHNPGGSEQVFRGGVPLHKVASAGELTAESFCVDLEHQRLYLHGGRNPDETAAAQPIVASTREHVWIVTGAHVQTRGLNFRYAANRAQQGMAQFRGPNALVEDCTFAWSNSTGANFLAPDMTVRHCVFEDNGQQGFSGSHADRLLFDGCTVQRNNVKNYPRGWEAGGDKLCFSRGAILENSRFLKNHGAGVWFDIANVDCTVLNCLIADNEDAGIFYEISYGLHAHDNVVVGNGQAKTKGAWAANGGICISSSPGCVIERNLLAGNEQGFCFREQDRTTPRNDGTTGPEVPVWNHDEVVRNNLFVSNRTAQVQGWFDINPERHWPRALQAGKVPEGKEGKAHDDWAAGYQARKNGVPPGLTLEDLKISFQGNIYALEPNGPFFIWGTDWKRKEAFKDLPSLTRRLGFEDSRSALVPPVLFDSAQHDFRLPRDHPAITAGVYPQGKVPDCVLGMR